MLRIFLIIAVVGGVAATAISGYFLRNEFQQALADRDAFHGKWVTETDMYNKSQTDLKKTQTELGETKTKLTKTESDLAAANSRVSDLEGQNKDLSANLTRTRGELDDAQAQLDKWNQIGLKPEQVKGVIADLSKARQQIDDYVKQNKLLAVDRDNWKDLYEKLIGNNQIVQEPPGLRGKILAVDPKFGFVVINLGTDNNVRANGDFMVDNGGRFVGKVRVVSVEKDRCIANILPNWTRGDISEDCSIID